MSNGENTERRLVAWVGKSVIFSGTLISSEDMTIDGQVEGTIDVGNHTLTIGPDAHIRAEIAAKAVTIHGAVTGNVRAGAKIEIKATGRVEGDVTAPRIAVAEGGFVQGRVETAPADQTQAAARRDQLVSA